MHKARKKPARRAASHGRRRRGRGTPAARGRRPAPARASAARLPVDDRREQHDLERRLGLLGKCAEVRRDRKPMARRLDRPRHEVTENAGRGHQADMHLSSLAGPHMSGAHSGRTRDKRQISLPSPVRFCLRCGGGRRKLGACHLPSSLTPSPADAVLMFVESVGRRSEAELYLKLFRQLPRRASR